MIWTDAQREVIEKRNSDILVSAAAGSGKTAVLVERIISLVCDENDPADIDRILVVTFTRAAAGEMKDRIYSALLKRIKVNPHNRHILRQLSLIHNANITTIDGFCQYLVRNYFHEIDLDPAIRIADEGELVLLQNEVMEQLLEERYKEGREGFLALSDAFSVKDKDDKLIEMVFAIHEKAATYPYPVEWINALNDNYEAETKEELLASEWMRALVSHVMTLLNGLKAECEDLYEALTSQEEVHPYADAVASDLMMLRGLCECDDYERLTEEAAGITFAKLSTKKLKEEDPEIRASYKERRDRIKKELGDIKTKLLAQNPAGILADMKQCRGFVKELSSLAADYEIAYKQAKEKKGIMDFSDMEHFALDILIDRESHKRTNAAIFMSQYYRQIMVDEYQDSNLLQEMILSAITKEEDGRHDYFMVGDVKQSIYRFRQARPDIFIDKYDRYTDEDVNTAVIDLDKNFRSRHQVTDSVNAVFSSIMRKDMGGVEYDDRQKLVCGADYYQETEGLDLKTEIIIGDEAAAAEGEFDDAVSLEASIIAQRIRELIENGTVTDTITGQLRPVKLSDIAILHRSANSVGKKYLDVLKSFGIEAFMVSSTGYFSTVEVETILSLLKVINNPMQDIPLASVMKSPVFAFSDEELARIRTRYMDEPFYKAVKSAAEEEGQAKLKAFWERIENWRALSVKLPIYELLGQILRESGYMSYITALPGGEVRSRNIKKLIALSIKYENTSYKGLFYFTRYIERLKKYEQDMGQADVVSGNDAVKIMTIHKSKGLEFPIVFVAGCGKKIMTKSRGMLLHAQHGIGIHAIDLERRIKKETLCRSFIYRTEQIGEKGEELRILYVAMTRAKEKLIMTGVIPEPDKMLDKSYASMGRLSFVKRLKAANYLELILPAALQRQELFSVKKSDLTSMLFSEVAWQTGAKARLSELKDEIEAVSEDEISRIKDNISFVYPHRLKGDAKVKYSVSELKRSAMRESMDAEDAKRLFEADEKGEVIPEFISGEKLAKKGALKGTAVHRYLECFDFEVDEPAKEYESQLDIMLSSQKLTGDEAELLPEYEIKSFLSSELAARMKEAAKKDLLKKEAAFVMADSPSHFLEDKADDENDDMILVQGIIDVFFEEDDGIVLVDYKTDRIRTEKELVDRYYKQMVLYSDALGRVYDKPVKEIILYSFALGRSIYV